MAKKTTQGAPEVQETMNQNEAFFLKYKNAIIGCTIAAIVIICGVIFWNSHAKSSQEKACTQMATAEELFGLAVQYGDSAIFSRALNGDSTGVAGFLNIIDEYGSTDAGNVAKLYAGLCYAHMGQWEKAADYLNKFSDAGDQMVSPAALGALGDVYAHIDQLDKAVDMFKKAAKKADNTTLTPIYLVKAGEILESQGKKAEALQLYQQVKDQYVQSAAYQTIDEYIERVK